MSDAIVPRSWLVTPLAAGVALLYGVLIGVQPHLVLLVTVALAYGIAVAVLAFVAPVAHLFLLLFLTTVIPYSVQHGFSTHPGLLPSDAFLLTGLARAAIVLSRTRLGRRRMTMLGLVILFEALVMISAVAGFRSGRSISAVGAEARSLMGFSVGLICMALLVQEGAERRVMRALLGIALLTGLLGLAQWTLHLSLSDSQDFGVRPGVSFTSNGVGQIQGGLFAFPLAVIICVAALASGKLRSRGARLAVIAALSLNALSLLVTFERTMWLATGVGTLLIVLRSKRVRRIKALLWTMLIAVASVGALSAFAPAILQTAVQRFASIGQYQTDDSLRQRQVESDHVLQEIRKAPALGAGLAASVWFGRPWQQVEPRAYTYTHDGYLWLLWRLGAVGTIPLLALLLLAISWTGPPPGDPLLASVRVGCQVGLLAMLVIGITFPPFSGFGITSALGVLVGICAQPRVRGAAATPARAAAPPGLGVARVAGAPA